MKVLRDDEEYSHGEVLCFGVIQTIIGTRLININGLFENTKTEILKKWMKKEVLKVESIGLKVFTETGNKNSQGFYSELLLNYH